MWRLVLGRVATLEEIESRWTLSDLVRGNQVLTLHLEQQRPPKAER